MRCLIRSSVILFLIGLGFVCAPAFSDESTPTAPEAITSATPASTTTFPNHASPESARLWNLQDADILSVINEVAQETGKNFVVDPRVSGKVTLISSKPLPGKDVYQVFLSVLSVLGYSAIPNGEVIKIVPNMESSEQGARVATAQVPGQGDEVVVRVIPLLNVSATQLIPVVRPLLPQWSNISSYTPGNVLLLSGRAANLERIATIIQDVDSAANNGIQIVPLHHASAREVVNVVNNLQSQSRGASDMPSVSLAVDERSNSVLLSGPKLARLKIRMLIAELDAPSKTPTGNTEVVYLRYLQAKNLAPLLSKVAQNIEGKDTGSPLDTGGRPARPANAVASDASSGTHAPGAYIQAEPNTNAIIITAPPTLMASLKAVIAKLDIRPAQVLVEAIIAEVDESNLRDLGIQWGSVTSSGMVTSTPTITSFPNFGAGVVGIMPSVQIQSVLSVLQNLNGVDILSTPTIMVLDNQKATIEIGQDVPYQTGSYATTGGSNTVTPFTTIEEKPVTLKLDVTPQINLGRSVRMKLALKNDTLQNPLNPGLNPIINTSRITNSVIINSDDVLVLGGLISHTHNENINKVPILGDLPFLGPLFQQKTTRQDKKNLMVFIKPIIVNNEVDAMTISQSKYRTIQHIQANYVEDLVSIGKIPPNRPSLPPWRNQKALPQPFAEE